MDQNPKEHPIFEGISIGVGTWAWGDRLYWGYGQGYAAEDVRDAFQASLDQGIQFFDTAEAYGRGKSEKLLGEFVKATDTPVHIASKFMPFPWRLQKGSLLRALRHSLERLQLPSIDLYQIHFPIPPVTVETWMNAMAEAFQAGLIRAVGVSNYSRQQTQRAADALLRQGIQLASNQLEYSLLNRQIEFNGVLDECKQRGVKVIAYSPLAQGLLTGKYTPENPPTGFRARKVDLKELKPLLSTMKKIGDAHDGKTPAQVAINWTICKGTLPIPGAKSANQAIANAGGTGWALTDEEVETLDLVSLKHNIKT
ncbi:MAG TPA: aldo/keto reductase [Anaerolineaceae bacterium]|nr:aldo/keto reductase [Anaerolineaceae bacterium]